MEDVIKIEGKHKLKGTVRIGGSKRSNGCVDSGSNFSEWTGNDL